MQIIIERNVGLDDLDRFYGQLERAAEVEARVDLLLPRILDNNFMGLVPATYQFSITWIRYQHRGKLLLDIENPDEENWSDLLKNEHLFPIILLSWNKTGVYDRSGEINLKTYLKEPIALVRQAMLRVKPLKGWKLLLTSIDHFPVSSGLLPCFESPQGFINNEMNTYRNLKGAIEEILNFSLAAKASFESYERDFIAIIHELVKNTYEWGKTDQNNIPVDPSIRGVLFKFYKKRRNTFLDEFRTHKGLSEYFRTPQFKENPNGELYFLEISVYDSGVGFVEKYKVNNKESYNDVDVIKRCLIKHMTSASGLEKDDKGIGLDRILNLLDRKGFLRIKTHHSCLYRNLVSHPYKQVDDEKKMELFDWNNQSDKSYTVLPKAAGSTLTILYPLSLNTKE